ANSSMMTVSALKIEEINTVKIIPSENCVKNDDGTYTVTVPAEEEIAVADLINYDYDQSAPQYEVITDSTVDESSAIIEFLPRYNTVVLKGIAPNDNAGSFKIHIENADGIAETVFNVVVEESLMKPLPQIEALTPVSEESPILSIDFEGDDTTLYTYTDEYGRVTSDEVSWTSIEDTSNGLKYRSETAENPSDSGITGSAFYGWLTPENGTQKGNGYRGSRLVLDNEKVQRTDKIKVSYDFAIYNIVNVDNTGVDVGMPQVVSMTSEAVESGSIPYDFNDQHYREPDADVSDVNGISRHLLTFATGRSKRNSEGLHRLDMTNELGYFEPRYANDETPGRYKKLQGFTLLPNEFNFFHVDSEIDFYNNVIEFTITNTQDSTQTATITTTITEHASWDGFIVSSQKWDTSNPRDDSDIDGKDTEHYIYIDNIKSEKLAEDVANLITTAPEARPLIEDAIVKVNAENADTWKYNKAYDLHTDGENGYVDYSSEVESAYDFTSKLATGYSANGITSYTEFDFYLPKKGSYVTVYNRGSEGGGESYGNTLIISDAGICSWSGLEGYTPVYEENLECGKWYSLTVIYDHCGENETVILKDGDSE
ncbi:MAG: hypothetical protein IJX57_03970, partial [Clostridia bacterium]|nr:hypothetical protein [Clostridia bacterium]